MFADLFHNLKGLDFWLMLLNHSLCYRTSVAKIVMDGGLLSLRKHVGFLPITLNDGGSK